jgi:hypothetical protein
MFNNEGFQEESATKSHKMHKCDPDEGSSFCAFCALLWRLLWQTWGVARRDIFDVGLCRTDPDAGREMRRLNLD